MAHVKWYRRHSAARVLRYIMTHGEPGDGLSSHGCTPETPIDDFASTRDIHRSRGDTQVIHIMQSWSAEESHLLGKEQSHEIGRKLAERYFPGHEFVVKTHDFFENLLNRYKSLGIDLSIGTPEIAQSSSRGHGLSR